jgi:O-antigen ligase
MNSAALLRGLVVYVACVGVALLLGYVLANPLSYQSIFTIGILMGLILMPILLRWHHEMSIACWNLTMLMPLLPGKASLNFVIAGISLGISILTRTLGNKRTSVGDPWVSNSLLALALVTMVIWKTTGGFAGSALGTEDWGAGRYVSIMGAIIGYFAFVAKPVPLEKVKLLTSLHFLSGLSSIWPVLIVLAGPTFYILLGLFPSTLQAGVQFSVGEGEMYERFTGVMVMAQFAIWFLVLRYGVKGLFDLHRSWRLLLFLTMFALGLLGGFRSFVVLLIILFALQIWLEGLLFTRLFATVCMIGTILMALLIPFAIHLPLAIQRSFSFVPMIEIDAAARYEAEGTSDWRLDMWQVVLPEVPKHLWRPKGYNFSSTDLELTQQAMKQGRFAQYEGSIVTADYHQGLLNLIIPLGIYGFVAFLCFIFGCLRALYRNYRYSNPDLKLVNTFLLSFFLTRLIYFTLFYGAFYLDLMVFTGTIGMSLAVNAGVRSVSKVEEVHREPATTAIPHLHTA